MVEGVKKPLDDRYGGVCYWYQLELCDDAVVEAKNIGDVDPPIRERASNL